MKSALVSLATLAVLSAEAAPVKLWSIGGVSNQRSLEATSVPLSNRRLADVGEKYFFEFEFVSNKIPGSDDEFEVEFDIPENGVVATKTCVMKHGNPLVPAALADKFPDLYHLKGKCPGGEELLMTVDSNRADGMSAMFTKQNKKYMYVDSAVEGTKEYVIYASSDFPTMLYNFTEPEGVRITPAEEIPTNNNAAKAANRRQESTFAYKFVIAVLTHPTYSSFHGNTKDSVMAAVVTLFSRVNGVYMHEFGVYFELHSKTDETICLSGTTDQLCNGLSNDSDIIDENTGFFTSKGVAYSTYDLGHSLTTGSGGLAAYPALCTSNSKAAATTGMPSPINDPYAIDYVAHEVGHQLLGAHSFRDCNGEDDGNIMEEGAVEPGSASSIMGYAGICQRSPDHNIQSNSDPYFNNLNQQQMYDYVVSVQNDATCGTKFALNNVLPTITAPATCKVPVNQPFQLSGATTSQAGTFFSWDRIDTGYESFDSTTLGKFRSWKPTTFKSRFFPNLHFQNFEFANGGDDRVEFLPRVARSMTFRFTERRLYESDINAPELDLGLAGDFVYTDTTVNFIDINGNLELTAPAKGDSIQSGEDYTFTWNAAEVSKITNTVSVWIAVNTLDEVTDISTFTTNYETLTKELNWIQIGTADASTGSLTAKVPVLAADVDVAVNVMLRATEFSAGSAEAAACYFFDLATDLTLLFAEGQTPAPTTATTVLQPGTTPAPTPTTNGSDNSSGDNSSASIGFNEVVVIVVIAVAAFVVVFATLMVVNTIQTNNSKLKMAKQQQAEAKNSVPVGVVATKNELFDGGV